LRFMDFVAKTQRLGGREWTSAPGETKDLN
jgi:hypothetical protein